MTDACNIFDNFFVVVVVFLKCDQKIKEKNMLSISVVCDMNGIFHLLRERAGKKNKIK